MAGRASIVGAAATHVGKVREHNEDSHFFDADGGVFLVCDGMGGHAAGEVASALAIQVIRANWASNETLNLIDAWISAGSPETKKQMLASLRDGALAAHDAIISEASEDESKSGMGTTLVGAIVVGNELVFAHAGDSRAYLVRDAIAMQLTEDHTLLSRLLAAGIEVDVTGEGARFRSMLTNALGIGTECKVSTFVVPLADGDRFLFCSDGISEYIKEAEVGEVLAKQPSPARAAQKLIELALERGGGDNATAIVIRVLEAGETPQPVEHIRRDETVIASCPLWGAKVTPQQRLRALRIVIPREYAVGERIPAQTLGDRVAWIVVEGKVLQDNAVIEPGALIYPESLVRDSQAPDRDGLALARTDVRLLALRADDFYELCDDDPELGEALLESLQPLLVRLRARTTLKLDERGSERPDTEIDTDDARPDSQSDVAEPSVIVSSAPEPSGQKPVAGEIEIRPRKLPGTIDEALRARSELGDRIDERFEALGHPEPATQPAPKPEARIPLILTPRTITPPQRPSDVKLPPLPALKMPSRPATEPPIAKPRTLTPRPVTPRPVTPRPGAGGPRPLTEPEIETEIELEAEEPFGDGTIAEDEIPKLEAEPVDDADDADEEPTTIRPVSEPRAPAVAPRAKRLSEGWED